jgi:anti-sigma B factor antagonist
MKIKIRPEGSVMVIEPHGKMLGGSDSEKFRKKITKMVDEGDLQVVLNLRHVDHISSPGVGMIVGGFTTLKNRNGAFKICELGERVNMLFRTIYLWKVIEIYETEADAIRSFTEDVPTLQDKLEEGKKTDKIFR